MSIQRKHIFTLITLSVTLTLLGIFEANAQQSEYKVGSYNVRYDNAVDREKGNGWPNRLPVVTSLIEFIDYDIFGCQEVLHEQLGDMDSLLQAYDHVGVGRDDGETKGEYAPIFYKKDRFKLLDSGVFWLSQTPEKPSVGWDAALPRICTYAHVEDQRNGKRLWFFNLHMDHQGTKAREKSNELVLKRIQDMLEEDEMVILTGDFNVDQHNPIYRILAESTLLSDTYVKAQKRYAWNGTFNAFDDQLFTDSRIDHIFVSDDIEVLHYGVLTESYRRPAGEVEQVKKGDFPSELSFKNYESRLPSDHFPVVARVLF